MSEVKPSAWSVRHASGKYGFVTLDQDEAIKWASTRSDVFIHALGPPEHPEPVAVVLPERREIGPNYPYLSDLDIEWNACLDEVTRLNPSL